jgi:hypothetical protein
LLGHSHPGPHAPKPKGEALPPCERASQRWPWLLDSIERWSKPGAWPLRCAAPFFFFSSFFLSFLFISTK